MFSGFGVACREPIRASGYLRNSWEIVIFLLTFAGIAQLVERHLAKVNVAGSSPVSRSFLFRDLTAFVKGKVVVQRYVMRRAPLSTSHLVAGFLLTRCWRMQMFFALSGVLTI